MADLNPTGTDQLNSPSHSLQHRVYATDDANTTAAVRVDAGGNLVVLSGSGNFIRFGDVAEWSGTIHKTITVTNPTGTSIPLFRVFDSPCTIRAINVGIIGTGTPGITVNLLHNATLNSGGRAKLITNPPESNNSSNQAEASGHTTTDFSTGDPTVPSQHHVFLDITGNTGPVEDLKVDVYFTYDLSNT